MNIYNKKILNKIKAHMEDIESLQYRDNIIRFKSLYPNLKNSVTIDSTKQFQNLESHIVGSEELENLKNEPVFQESYFIFTPDYNGDEIVESSELKGVCYLCEKQLRYDLLDENKCPNCKKDFVKYLILEKGVEFSSSEEVFGFKFKNNCDTFKLPNGLNVKSSARAINAIKKYLTSQDEATNIFGAIVKINIDNAMSENKHVYQYELAYGTGKRLVDTNFETRVNFTMDSAIDSIHNYSEWDSIKNKVSNFNDNEILHCLIETLSKNDNVYSLDYYSGKRNLFYLDNSKDIKNSDCEAFKSINSRYYEWSCSTYDNYNYPGKIQISEVVSIYFKPSQKMHRWRVEAYPLLLESYFYLNNLFSPNYKKATPIEMFGEKVFFTEVKNTMPLTVKINIVDDSVNRISFYMNILDIIKPKVSRMLNEINMRKLLALSEMKVGEREVRMLTENTELNSISYKDIKGNRVLLDYAKSIITSNIGDDIQKQKFLDLNLVIFNSLLKASKSSNAETEQAESILKYKEYKSKKLYFFEYQETLYTIAKSFPIEDWMQLLEYNFNDIDYLISQYLIDSCFKEVNVEEYIVDKLKKITTN